MSAYRAYLNDKKDNSFDFGSSFSGEANIPELFSELTRRLETTYDIHKGVLALINISGDTFSAISSWKDGKVLDGLTISLPTNPSLFKEVASDGRVFTDSYSGIFSGNFFEKKLLLDDNSKSYVLHPLKHEGQVIGMLGYSSEAESAFTMVEEGALLKVTEEFSKIIHNRMINENLI